MNKLTESHNSHKTLWIIRIALIIPIFVVFAVIFRSIIEQGLTTDILNTESYNLQTLFETILALFLTFIPDFLEKQGKINLPYALETSLIIFIYASLFLGSALRFYIKFWWWDDLVHTLSGVIFGFIGLLFIHYLDKKRAMNLTPALIAVSVFTFSVTMGALWESFEFLTDVFFGTAMQQWNMPADIPLIGNENQGLGLRDTMSDLIEDVIGALIAAILTLSIYKNNKKDLKKLYEKCLEKIELKSK